MTTIEDILTTQKYGPQYMESRIEQLERRNDAHVRAINAVMDSIALHAGNEELKAEVKSIAAALLKELGDI